MAMVTRKVWNSRLLSTLLKNVELIATSYDVQGCPAEIIYFLKKG